MRKKKASRQKIHHSSTAHSSPTYAAYHHKSLSPSPPAPPGHSIRRSPPRFPSRAYPHPLGARRPANYRPRTSEFLRHPSASAASHDPRADKCGMLPRGAAAARASATTDVVLVACGDVTVPARALAQSLAAHADVASLLVRCGSTKMGRLGLADRPEGLRA